MLHLQTTLDFHLETIRGRRTEDSLVSPMLVIHLCMHTTHEPDAGLTHLAPDLPSPPALLPYRETPRLPGSSQLADDPKLASQLMQIGMGFSQDL